MQVWRRDGRGRRSRGASKTRKRTKPLARRALIGRGRILGDSARAGFAESILMRGSDAIDGRARVLPSRDSIDRSKRRSRFPTPHRRLANPKSGRRDVERSSIDPRRSADRSGRSERSHRFAALALTGKRSVRFFDARRAFPTMSRRKKATFATKCFRQVEVPTRAVPSRRGGEGGGARVKGDASAPIPGGVPQN